VKVENDSGHNGSGSRLPTLRVTTMADANNKGFVMQAVDALPKSKRSGGINTEFVDEAVKHLRDNPGQLFLLGVFPAPTAQQRKQKLKEKSGLGDELQLSTRTVDQVDEKGKKLTGVFGQWNPKSPPVVEEKNDEQPATTTKNKGKGSK
jgi:hypothetical protein